MSHHFNTKSSLPTQLQHALYFLFSCTSQIKCVQKLRFQSYIHYFKLTEYKILFKYISLFNRQVLYYSCNSFISIHRSIFFYHIIFCSHHYVCKSNHKPIAGKPCLHNPPLLNAGSQRLLYRHLGTMYMAASMPPHGT